MGYVDESLAPGEQLVRRGRLHWIYWVRAVAALLVLGVVIIGLVWFIKDVVLLTTTDVVLTNTRLIRKTGFVVRHARDLQLSSVEAVDLDQGLLGRLLDFGRLRVHGTGRDVWVTPLIADPLGFRRDLEGALSPRV
jgi:uncharacterized membrane protein YdbT with pleckstrin-like domain